MDKKTLKHLDLFSGYGGFTIPASKYGIETINFSEIDKYATAVLKYRFPSITNLGDITKIKSEDLPDVDIITGGSPCQDLSVAGKGAGLNGERSGLFFHFIRLIKEKQPMYFIWENVKGALSSSHGWDFARVQIEMEQAGYDVFWQVINAKDFGVPQNRERIFAIGIRKGSGREILFEQRESRQNPNKIVNTGHEGTKQKALGGGQGAKTGLYAINPKMIDYRLKDEASALTASSYKEPQAIVPVAIPNPNGNIHSLDANCWKGSNNPNPMYAVVKNHGKLREIGGTATCIDSHYSQFPDNHGQRTGVIVHNLQPRSPNRPSLLKNKNAGGSGHLQREDGITYTVDTGCTQGVEIAVPMRWSRTEEGKRVRKEAMKNGKDYTPFSGGARTLTESKEDVSGCLTNALNKDALLKHDMRIRRLTPTECERLMGLEDGEKCGIIRLWQKEIKNSPTNRIGANVEKLNGRVVKPVGSVGKTGSQENVPFAKKSFLSKSQNTKEPVVLNVQVNSEKNSIKIWQGDNEEELLLSVSGVEKKGKFPNHGQIADFVQMVVGLNTILWRETHNGKVESQVREQPLILQKNGVPVLNMHGRNTTPLVRDVEKDLITLNQHLKSIISLDSKIKNYEQNIQTLFSSAIPVITGFIPTKIKIESISEIRLSILSGWTAKGIIDGKEVDISDTQRYKMCGNGVVVNCVDYIYNLISKTL